MLNVSDILTATGGMLLAGGPEQEFRGVSIDSRTAKVGELFVAIRGERFDGHDYVRKAFQAGAAGGVIQHAPGVGATGAAMEGFGDRVIIQVQDTLRALQDLARSYRSRFDTPLIAVTGSNGKTTTKEMASSILGLQMSVLKNEGNLNNHIGVPLTLFRLRREHQVAVIEMGINRPGELRRLCDIARPRIGLITNIGPTHLEFLENLEGVARAKGELLEGLGSDSLSILNADDAFFGVLVPKVNGARMTFGIESEADVRASEVVVDPSRAITFRLKLNTPLTRGETRVRLPLIGRHNIYNALGAAAIAAAQGLDIAIIKQGLERFEPISMRSQFLELEGVHVLNDAYNANPASMKSAIEAMAGLKTPAQKIAVLGDMLELGEGGSSAHLEVGQEVAHDGIQYLVTLGPLAGLIAQGARQAGMNPGCVFESTGHQDAAEIIRKIAKPGDYILLKGSRKMQLEKIINYLRGQ